MPGTVKYDKYAQEQHITFGTTLIASGTPVVAPSAGQRIMLDYISLYLVDPSGSNTVTLGLGTVTMPPLGLSSSRTLVTLSSYVLGTAQAITATLSGSGSVGFFGTYLIATD